MLILSRLPLPLRVAAFSACLAVLSWLSLTPQQELPQVKLSDKFEHTVAYAILCAVSLLLFPGRARTDAAICLGFGVLIEFLQAAMGLGRQGDWRDVVANSLGVLLVVAPYAAWRLRRRRS